MVLWQSDLQNSQSAPEATQKYMWGAPRTPRWISGSMLEDALDTKHHIYPNTTVAVPRGSSPVKADVEMNGAKYREILQSQSSREQRGIAPRHTVKTTQRQKKKLFLPHSCAPWWSLSFAKNKSQYRWKVHCSGLVFLHNISIWRKLKCMKKIEQVSKVQPMWTSCEPVHTSQTFVSCPVSHCSTSHQPTLLYF